MKIGERELPTGEIESLTCRIQLIEDLIGDKEPETAYEEMQSLLGDFIHHPDYSVRDLYMQRLEILIDEIIWRLSMAYRHKDESERQKALITIGNLKKSIQQRGPADHRRINAHVSSQVETEMENNMRKIDPDITSFRMEREGQFLAHWSSVATKCGPATAQPIYEYKCVIVCAPSLDENGFIIDNLEIHDYFVKTYGTGLLPAVSCERMAAHAVKTIRAKCSKIELPLISVSVSISGMKGAWLTAKWDILSKSTIMW